MLILTRKLNEKIKIGNDITITITEIRGEQVKIGVEAPNDVKVFRQEVFQAIRQENRAASTAGAADTADALKQLGALLPSSRGV
jgi:carbon storage regulator